MRQLHPDLQALIPSDRYRIPCRRRSRGASRHPRPTGQARHSRLSLPFRRATARQQGYPHSFVTDLPVAAETVAALAACGRARWKIENKTLFRPRQEDLRQRPRLAQRNGCPGARDTTSSRTFEPPLPSSSSRIGPISCKPSKIQKPTRL